MLDTPTRTSKAGEPVWELAHLFPEQGAWSEEEYLALDTNHLVEFSHGFLEFLPMPTQSHQFIALYLYRLLLMFIKSQRLGTVLVSPLKVRLWAKKYREPDIMFMFAHHRARRKNTYWEGADLVMEVVSRDDPARDVVLKREEYAQAGIPEYWLVDPRNGRITVFTLPAESTTYQIHGEFGPGEQATSVLLPGFGVEVTAVFAAADE